MGKIVIPIDSNEHTTLITILLFYLNCLIFKEFISKK